MKLHDLIFASPQWLWLTLESRTTYRETGCHLWNPKSTPVPSLPVDHDEAVQTRFAWQPFLETATWNQRPPPALCGYRPRLGTMRIGRYTSWQQCRNCHRAANERGILGENVNDAIRRDPQYIAIQAEYVAWSMNRR